MSHDKVNGQGKAIFHLRLIYLLALVHNCYRLQEMDDYQQKDQYQISTIIILQQGSYESNQH